MKLRGRAVRRPWAASALLLMLALVTACGHRGAPRPPAPHVPSVPEEVLFRQRGDLLQIEARVRLTGLRDEALRPPVRPVLLAFVAETAQLAEGWDRSTRDREFVRSAEAFPLEPVAEDRLGQRVRLLREIAVERFPESEALVLALAIEDDRGRSMPSRRRVFVPAEPALPALDGVSSEVLEDRVRLRWELPKDERVKSVRVYRSTGDEPFSARPWRQVEAAAGSVVDDDARYGQQLTYRLAAAARAGEVPAESPAREIGPIDYEDVFPPDPVVDLEAVPSRGVIRVLWFPGGSADEAGALVQRQARGQDRFHVVGRVDLPDADYTDDDVQAGESYRYRVLAVDAAGNAAEPAGPTPWVQPLPEEEQR